MGWCCAADTDFIPIARYLFDLLRQPFAQSRRGKRKPPVPIEITVRWYVSSLLSMLTWWLDSNVPFPAEKLAEHFRLLTAPGLAAALEAEITAVRTTS